MSLPVSSAATLSPSSVRYELGPRVAAGGMGEVYVGRLRGPEGFWRLVAIKRAHPHLLRDPAFRQALLEEAHLASKLHHTNVVSVQDVEQAGDELRLIMDYIEGASMSQLVRACQQRGLSLPPEVAVRVVLDACAGLHAAHELRDERGQPRRVVHRDVSPQNILVGLDGVARLSDFGIAKALGSQLMSTETGVLKGKIAYMAPEYVANSKNASALSDVYAMGVVLYEALTGQRLFDGGTAAEIIYHVMNSPVTPVSYRAPWLGTDFDAPIARALARQPELRQPSARALAAEIEEVAARRGLVARPEQVSALVNTLVGAELTQRRQLVHSSQSIPPPSAAPGSVSASSAPTATPATVPMLSGPTTAPLAVAAAAAAAAPAPPRRSPLPWLLAALLLSAVVGVVGWKLGTQDTPAPAATATTTGAARATAHPGSTPAATTTAAGKPTTTTITNGTITTPNGVVVRKDGTVIVPPGAMK